MRQLERTGEVPDSEIAKLFLWAKLLKNPRYRAPSKVDDDEALSNRVHPAHEFHGQTTAVL